MASELELTEHERRKGQRDARLKQKQASEQQLAEDDRRKLWEELLEEPRRAAALFKLGIDSLLEEYHTRLENLLPEEVANKSRTETIPQESRTATDKHRVDTQRSRSEETDQEIRPGSQNPEGASSSSSSPYQLREDQQPLLPHSDEPRNHSLQEEIQKVFKIGSKRKEFETNLREEAAKIEVEKWQLLETWKAPKSLEAEVHLRYLLQVLDKKELDNVYERRIKADKGLIEELDREPGSEVRGRTAEGDITYVDSKRGSPQLPDSYTEIKRLLDIENHPVYVTALQEWSRKEALFSNRVERKKKIVSNLKNEIYQLIGFFSVFQGVVLAAVAQSNFLRCHNLWSPISLSVLASVASISGVVQKLAQIKAFQRTIDSEEDTLKTAVASGQRLRLLGTEKFSFATSVQETTHKSRQGIIPRWVYYFLVTVTLFAFGVLFPVSYWRILCYADAPAPAPAPAH